MDGFNNLRIGIGHDTHRLGPGGDIVLGGVKIPHNSHLIGYSDADVLLHAITDAILGALGLGDIGQHFPDTDEANRGRDSAEMLAEVVKVTRSGGWEVQNLDCIVFAERPKIAHYRADIRQRVAELLQISPSAVNVKGKTGEGTGPVGRGEAIIAECVVLMRRDDEPSPER